MDAQTARHCLTGQSSTVVTLPNSREVKPLDIINDVHHPPFKEEPCCKWKKGTRKKNLKKVVGDTRPWQV